MENKNQQQAQAGMQGMELYGDEDAQVISRESQAVAEATRARIQTAFFMAYKNPRDEDKALERMLKTCSRPKFAQSAMYEKIAGRDKQGNEVYVSGLSIRFAEMAIREYRNIFIDTQTVFEDEYRRVKKVYCTDLESNTTFTADLTLQKTVEREPNKITGRKILGQRTNSRGEVVYLVEATEQELYNKENAGISKAIRNQGLRLIPQHIIEEAQETIEDTINNMDKSEIKIDKMLEAYAEKSISRQDIEAYMGKTIEQLEKRELVKLRRLYQAIQEGFITWHQVAGMQGGGTGERTDSAAGDEAIEEKLGGDESQDEIDLQIAELWKLVNKELDVLGEYAEVNENTIPAICGIGGFDRETVEGMQGLVNRLKNRITKTQVEEIDKYSFEVFGESEKALMDYVADKFAVGSLALLTKGQSQQIIDYLLDSIKGQKKKKK